MSEYLTVGVLSKQANGQAIAEALLKDPRVKTIILPRNHGLVDYKREKEIIVDPNCDLSDRKSVLEFAQRHQADWWDIADAAAIASGAGDNLLVHGIPVFGPIGKAKDLEASKTKQKILIGEAKIPSALWIECRDTLEGIGHIYQIFRPGHNPLHCNEVYIKPDGMTGEIGPWKVKVGRENLSYAIGIANRMESLPNGAGKSFYIEAGLRGEEFSLFTVTDGKTHKTFKTANDFLSLREGQQGPVTFGLGGNSPALLVEHRREKIAQKLANPLLNCLSKSGHLFQGILYTGGIKWENETKALKYNAHWGHPEGQYVLPGIQNYAEIQEAVINQTLDQTEILEDSKYRVGIVMVAKGFPNSHQKIYGQQIFGLDEALKLPGVSLYDSSIKRVDDSFYVAGPNPLTVVGEGDDLRAAYARAVSAAERIYVGNRRSSRLLRWYRDVAGADRARFT